MLDILRPRKKKSLLRPKKEKQAKTVPVARFNAMIEFYTKELQSRLKEIQRLKTENEMLIKTSIRNASRTDEFSESSRKLSEEVRILQNKLRDARK